MTSSPATPGSPLPGLACNCHALRRAARRATALYDGAMAPHGLRISQFALLSRLLRSGPAGVQALAAALAVDRTTLGRNLRPLERDGLVVSETDPGDRRVRRLRISPAGAALVNRAVPAWQDAQRRFESQFGAAAAASLRGELHRLMEEVRVPEEGSADD